MLSKLEKNIKITTSMCDNTGSISIPSIFPLFSDLAGEHAPLLGLGSDALAKKNLFWIAVRTKIKIKERPSMLNELRAVTWPEAPGKVRCLRDYMLLKNEVPVISGKTEWAIIDIFSGRPQKLLDVYPEELLHCDEIAFEDDFNKISEDFSGCELLGKYRVNSCDIDIGQHMNNATYIRAVFGLFSCEEIEKMDIRDIEINFRSPCYEGDELSVFIRKAETSFELGVFRQENKLAATIKLA